MPEVLLFGATGYTGRLTAEALARRGADFAIAGRDRAKLERLASTTGNPDVRVASVGDIDGLAAALEDVKVLITCVGPFSQLGETAVEAALRAKVHYVDSTGEGPFIGTLIESCTDAARAAGIAMVPSMGFDEVPADSAAYLAAEGMTNASLRLTYSLPLSASAGTLRSLIGIAASKGPWLEDGAQTWVGAGDRSRWAPMPPPLGPKRSVSLPLAEGRLAPLHLDVRTLETYITVETAERIGIKLSAPFLPLLSKGFVQGAIGKLIDRLPEGPTSEQRRKSHWTVLAEARSGSQWRNVAISGTDAYGLTAEFLSAGALKIASDGPEEIGVVAPVQAMGIETFQKEFAEHGVTVETYEPK